MHTGLNHYLDPTSYLKPYTLKATGSCHETFLFTALFISFSTSLQIGNFISQCRSAFPLPSIAFSVVSTTICSPFASGSSSSLYKTHKSSRLIRFSREGSEIPGTTKAVLALPRSGLGQSPRLCWRQKRSHLR